MFGSAFGGGNQNPITKIVDRQHGRRRSSLGSAKSGRSDGERSAHESEEETVVDDGEKSILLSIISQLRPGADLSRITLPTFILEPKSMLERITNFMQHPDMLLKLPMIEDPTERFVSVVRFYLGGWHIKPCGVKKPLNPILGEYFTCYWNFDQAPGTRAFYIAEQTSHHPPKSSYFYMAPHHHIRIDGTVKPQSRFLGNSAASMMTTSLVVLRLLNRGASTGMPSGGEKYMLTQPNMYVRGILFGKMKYELGDHSTVRCPELDLVADIEFKVKGFFTGEYNAICGYIKKESSGEILYEISGSWTGEMFIKNSTTGKRELLFDATHASATPPSVRPLAEQDERESQRLWKAVTSALKRRDQETATDEKFKIEDRQREEARTREADGVEWRPRYFREVEVAKGEEEDLDYIIAAHIDDMASPDEQTQQILNIAPITGGTSSKRSSKYEIPPHHSPSQSKSQSLIDDFSGDPAPPLPPPVLHLIDLDAPTAPAAKNLSASANDAKGDRYGARGKVGGGLEEMGGLKKALPEGGMSREGSTVSSRDEFYDAAE